MRPSSGTTALTVSEQKFVFREAIFEYMVLDLGLGGATPQRFKVRSEMIDSRVSDVETYYAKCVQAACVVVLGDGAVTEDLAATFRKVGLSAVTVANRRSTTSLMGGLSAGGTAQKDDGDGDADGEIYPDTRLPVAVAAPLDQRLQAAMNDEKAKATDWSAPLAPSASSREMPCVGVVIHSFRKIISGFGLGLVIGTFVLLWMESWGIQGVVYLAAANSIQNSGTAASNEIRKISQNFLVTPSPVSFSS